MENNRALIGAVKKTLDRKLNPHKKRRRIVPEFKGYGTSIEVKKYFNSYLIKHLQGTIDPNVPLDIHHRGSHQELGLQAVDVFSWGVYRKYENADSEWLEFFKDRIRCDLEYPLK